MRKLLMCFFVAIGIVALAQENKLSIENTQIGRYREFYPDNLSELQWQPGKAAYSYNTYEKIILQDVKSKQLIKSIDLMEMLETYNAEHNCDVKYLSHQWLSATDLLLFRNNHYMRYSIDKDSIVYFFQVPENAENITKSPNGNYLAYTIDNNLFVTDSIHQTIRVSHDSVDGITNGQVVHRNEFGISGGIFWSPESDKIAFYRKDETMVEQYPLVDITTPIASVNYIRYPMAGRKSHEVTIGVFEIATKSLRFLNTIGPKDHYFTNVTWDDDDDILYIQELNRAQDHMSLKKYNLENLDGLTIYEERNDKYVEPQHPLYFLKSKPGKFIYHARTDGYFHLYLFTDEGELVKQLTSGEWEVLEYLGADKDYVYHLSTYESPLSISVCKTNIKSGKTSVLNKYKGDNSAVLNYRQGMLLNTVNNREIANKILVLDTKGKEVTQLLNSEDKYKVFDLGIEKEGTIKAADKHTDLHYRLILPPDFDSTKKYPVIVYLYGGPHAQIVTNSYYGRTDLWLHYMAQEGYVGFMMDNRGSSNRGLAFENVTHRKLGVEEMKDQLKGVEFLKSLPYTDSTRFGVYGWSFGGFMTTSLMTTYPGVYSVAACGGPVINWEWYEVMYGERYMDTPSENPDGYSLTNVCDKAKNLEGKLLVIHGAQDPVVVWQHSLSFIEACIKANRPIDYFVYPTHEHGVSGMDYVHLMSKISNYFFDNL